MLYIVSLRKTVVVVWLRFFCLNINYNPFLASFMELVNTGGMGGNVIIVDCG